MTPLDREKAEYARLRERLQEAYGLEDGDDALLDTLEGETDLTGLLAHMVRVAKSREADADACRAQMDLLRARKMRLEDGAAKLRKLVAETMLEMGVKKLAPGDFSASARMTAPRPKVTEETELPDFYTKSKRVADLDAIKGEYERCVAEGDAFHIPGVVITNGEPSLTVRI